MQEDSTAYLLFLNFENIEKYDSLQDNMMLNILNVEMTHQV